MSKSEAPQSGRISSLKDLQAIKERVLAGTSLRDDCVAPPPARHARKPTAAPKARGKK